MRRLIGLTLFVGACVLAGCSATVPPEEAVALPEPIAAPPADTFEAQLASLADQITTGLKTRSARRIAVIPFQNLDGTVTELGAFIAEEMLTKLYQTSSFEVVEREMLNKVMAEHDLAASGIIDEDTAKRLGKLLGVDAIATGSISDLGSKVRINSRLIATETGAVFSAAAATLPKDQMTADLMGRVLQRGATGTSHASGRESSSGAGIDLPPDLKPGLLADYYNLAVGATSVPVGTPVFSRIDANIDFSTKGTLVPRINVDWFAIRWSGFIHIETPGIYTLSFVHDDILRIWIDGKRVYNGPHYTAARWINVDVSFEQSGWLPVRAEFIEETGGATCGFRWAKPGAAEFETVGADHFRHQPR